MKKLFIILLLPFIFSCKEKEKVETEKEPIRFEFLIEYIDKKSDVFKINASLYNDRNDTVYFIISSCYQYEAFLQIDREKYNPAHFWNCCYDNPVLEKIIPKSSCFFSTKGTWRRKNQSVNDSIIRIGFDFYEVEKNINLDSIRLYWMRKEKNIIWHETKLK